MEDDPLKDALQTYVKQGLRREEAIFFLQKYFPQYAWSIRSLEGRLRHFGVYYKDDFRLKMLKRLLKRNWKAQESYWGIEACTSIKSTVLCLIQTCNHSSFLWTVSEQP